jgi:hypothetical protein
MQVRNVGLQVLVWKDTIYRQGQIIDGQVIGNLDRRFDQNLAICRVYYFYNLEWSYR